MELACQHNRSEQHSLCVVACEPQIAFWSYTTVAHLFVLEALEVDEANQKIARTGRSVLEDALDVRRRRQWTLDLALEYGLEIIGVTVCTRILLIV